MITLTLLESFNAMRTFLNLYCEQNKADDIVMLLGGLHLANNHSDWQENPRTFDPPAWDDWMDGVHKTLQDLNIKDNPKVISYDDKASFLCMKNYLQLFYNQFSFDDIGDVLKVLDSANQEKNNFVWNQWMKSIDHVKNNTYDLDTWY